MTYLIMITIVLLDQISKYLAVKNIVSNGNYKFFNGLLELKYVKNYGAAFGILQEKKWIFIIITIIVICVFMIYLIRYSSEIHLLNKIALSMLIGGAIGNFIDRIRLGYVVDFIRVDIIKSINFPVFNIADIFIVIGTILLMIITIFPQKFFSNGESI
ncbi:MAG TPA: signal peptidase II [Soehngenia sp.]|nr:signal peptidase II [Soehngenia sp.]HPP31332.1 signal peptidase II [Soehngenia sp.]